MFHNGKNCADRAGAHSASADPAAAGADSTGAAGTCANFCVCSPKISTSKKNSRDISPVSPTFCISGQE